jgi:hypothetical protein
MSTQANLLNSRSGLLEYDKFIKKINKNIHKTLFPTYSMLNVFFLKKLNP